MGKEVNSGEPGDGARERLGSLRDSLCMENSTVASLLCLQIVNYFGCLVMFQELKEQKESFRLPL